MKLHSHVQYAQPHLCNMGCYQWKMDLGTTYIIMLWLLIAQLHDSHMRNREIITNFLYIGMSLWHRLSTWQNHGEDCRADGFLTTGQQLATNITFPHRKPISLLYCSQVSSYPNSYCGQLCESILNQLLQGNCPHMWLGLCRLVDFTKEYADSPQIHLSLVAIICVEVG